MRPTPEKRKERFLNGPHDEMQTVLANIPFADLEALVDSAIQMEGKLNQANENCSAAWRIKVGLAIPRSFAPAQVEVSLQEQQTPDAELAPRTGSNAIPVATKDKATITCYECGVVGHYSDECPKRLAKLAGNTAAPAQQQCRVSTGKKFAPNNPNIRNGRLYHMNAEEAQEAPDVVLATKQPTYGPFEALYEGNVVPLNWSEVGESQVFGPDVLREAEEKVHKIREYLKTAQSRQTPTSDAGDDLRDRRLRLSQGIPLKGMQRFQQRKARDPIC
ncbi:hypothetical protein QYE76_026972 [Lolium multiflorum]|uniref:CCHC-type domain-containing protein n=1 Tax=Lolium multiflorum TaxID=4521 RepID=A0AAD8PH64_LOLMU|nr:hypothetical protein QYE76_026972 [Lolium multiflorum]